MKWLWALALPGGSVILLALLVRYLLKRNYAMREGLE